MNLLNSGPITTSIIADNNFMSYKSSIFRCEYSYSDSLVNHAVQVVGYNLSGNYYIIKNSWGTNWGINGFGYIHMDYDCYISRQVYQFSWEWGILTPLMLASLLVIVS